MLAFETQLASGGAYDDAVAPPSPEQSFSPIAMGCEKPRIMRALDQRWRGCFDAIRLILSERLELTLQIFFAPRQWFGRYPPTRRFPRLDENAIPQLGTHARIVDGSSMILVFSQLLMTLVRYQLSVVVTVCKIERKVALSRALDASSTVCQLPNASRFL